MEPEPTPTPPPDPPPGRSRRGFKPGVGRYPVKPVRGRHAWAPGQLMVDTVLSPEDREAYFAFLRKPGTTESAALRWLHERGYALGRSAVSRHRNQFLQRIEAVRQAAEMSYACGELARQTGVPVLTDGAMARFETLLSQALFDMEAGGKLEREQWDMLGKALTNAVNNRSRLEELRRTFDDAKRAAAEAADRAAREGGDAKTVVDRVKEILGV